MLDKDQLASLLQSIGLAQYRIESVAARQALQSVVDAGTWGLLMPDTHHAGLAMRCKVVQVGSSHLLLQTEIDATAGWRPTTVALPLGRDVLRFLVRDLRPDAAGSARDLDGQTTSGSLLRCGYPPAVWQMPRREVFRVAPPAQSPVHLQAHGPSGVSPWQATVVDLGIGGLAALVAACNAPCQVDDILPACTLADDRYASPPFNLRVRSVVAADPPGHWRIGASLLDPSREVISSLQLATYRFETEQRRQRLAQRGGAGVNPLLRRVDRR